MDVDVVQYQSPEFLECFGIAILFILTFDGDGNDLFSKVHRLSWGFETAPGNNAHGVCHGV